MAHLQRLVTHYLGGWGALARCFPADLLSEMTTAIGAGEQTHLGEVRFAVEARLNPGALLDGLDSRARAEQVFSELRVWDTEHNSGILFYVLLAERRIEIVADRGIVARVDQSEWNALCGRMRNSYARGEWRDGSLAGIADAHALLTRHFPSDGTDNPDELPNEPILL